MFATLAAVLCLADMCVEKIVIPSESAQITFQECMIHGQSEVSAWMATSKYRNWTLAKYRCAPGHYEPRVVL